MNDKPLSEQNVQELLTAYSQWLEKKGYMDSDWYCEEPNTVDEFLRDKTN